MYLKLLFYFVHDMLNRKVKLIDQYNFYNIYSRKTTSIVVTNNPTAQLYYWLVDSRFIPLKYVCWEFRYIMETDWEKNRNTHHRYLSSYDLQYNCGLSALRLTSWRPLWHISQLPIYVFCNILNKVEYLPKTQCALPGTYHLYPHLWMLLPKGYTAAW